MEQMKVKLIQKVKLFFFSSTILISLDDNHGKKPTTGKRSRQANKSVTQKYLLNKSVYY